MSQEEFRVLKHLPVMLEESLAIFKGKEIRTFFDGTLGAGGFAHALLSAHPEVETYYGCDQDQEALELAEENLQAFKGKVNFIHANFSDLKEELQEKGAPSIDGFFLTWEYRQCS